MDAYAKSLPLEHRDRMPSLRKLYKDLGGPLHDGKDEAELFEPTREAIKQHFEIRRIYKIADAVPKSD